MLVDVLKRKPEHKVEQLTNEQMHINIIIWLEKLMWSIYDLIV